MVLALDTETTGSDFFHGCKPFLVSTCDDQGHINYWEWPVDPETRRPIIPTSCQKELQEFIDDQSQIVMHNTKFDVRALESIGIQVDPNKVEDTIIASHLITSSSPMNLKHLAREVVGIDNDDETRLKEAVKECRRIAKTKGWNTAHKGHPDFPGLSNVEWWKLDMWLPRLLAEDHNPDWFTVTSEYAVKDAERTIALWLAASEELKKRGLWSLYQERKQLIRVTYDMESRGVSISKDRINKQTKEFTAIQKYCEDFCTDVGEGLENLNSSNQLRPVLFDQLGMEPVKETEKSDPDEPTWATDKETLDTLYSRTRKGSIQRAFLSRLVKHRAVSQALGYLKSYQNFSTKSKRFIWIHPSFNITGTRTTRFSCKNPNAQNIGKRENYNIRYVFGPTADRIWYSIDYDNIELRIFAYCCGDQNLIQAFEKGLSVHMVIAEVLHPHLVKSLGVEGFKKTDTYRRVKNGNFSLIYGAGEKRADRTYGIKGAYRRIRSEFPKIDEFMEEKATEARETGQVITLGGYPLEVDRDKPHSCVNYFVQGTAGIIMMRGLNAVHEYLKLLGPNFHMNMVIHDEIDFDFPRNRDCTNILRNIKKLMERPGTELNIPTPVSVDLIDNNWSQGVAL